MNTTTDVMMPEMMTLPELSVRHGLPLDKLRKLAKPSLAPAGLLRKVGPNWMASSNDVNAIRDRVQRPLRELRAAG